MVVKAFICATSLNTDADSKWLLCVVYPNGDGHAHERDREYVAWLCVALSGS